MVVLPLSRLPKDHDGEPNTGGQGTASAAADDANWVRIAAAATLIASGALMLTGRRRAGLLVGATGTGLALLDQQDTLSKWWAMLPEYIGDVQQLLDQAEGAVEEFAAQREKLASVLGR